MGKYPLKIIWEGRLPFRNESQNLFRLVERTGEDIGIFFSAEHENHTGWESIPIGTMVYCWVLEAALRHFMEETEFLVYMLET